MLKLTSKIELYNGNSESIKYTFTFVNEIEIVSTWDSLTDTCKITIPRNINFKDKVIKEVFAKGDKVKIYLGYDENYVLRFSGFITKVDLKLPIVLHLEDYSYLLKNNKLTKKSYSSVDTKTLLKYIVGNVVNYVVTSNQTLGQFIIQDGVTTTEVLKYLQENHKIYSWFRDNTLYVGLAYYNQLATKHYYDVNKNVIDNNLEYNDLEDIKIKIKAVSVNQEIVGGKSKEKKITVYYPSETSDGSVRTYNGSMNISESDLKKEAQAYYESLRFDGYSGSFNTFGAPAVNHNDIVIFKSNEIPEQNESEYLVKSVTINFGVNGYRNIVELGGLVNG